jgi:hypothetical protein
LKGDTKKLFPISTIHNSLFSVAFSSSDKFILYNDSLALFEAEVVSLVRLIVSSPFYISFSYPQNLISTSLSYLSFSHQQPYDHTTSTIDY